jgi:hypothetical protein
VVYPFVYRISTVQGAGFLPSTVARARFNSLPVEPKEILVRAASEWAETRHSATTWRPRL